MNMKTSPQERTMNTNTELPKNAKLLTVEEAEELFKNTTVYYLDKETGEICRQSISLPASPIRGTELLIIGHVWQTAMHLVIQSPLWERLMESLSEKATAMQAELDAARCRGAVVENIEFGRNSDAHGRSVRSLSGEVDCFVPTIKNRDSNDHVHVDDVLHAISADDFNKRIIHSDSKITE